MKWTKHALLIIPVIFSFVLIYLVTFIILNPVLKEDKRKLPVDLNKEEIIKDVEKTLISENIDKKIPPKKHKKIENSDKEAEEFVNLIIKEAVEEFHNKKEKKEKDILDKIKDLF